jgi:hypothetical protein
MRERRSSTAQIAESEAGRASSLPLGGVVLGTDLTYDIDAGR